MEEWDELANYILADPDEILSSYNQKLWWNCPQGHNRHVAKAEIILPNEKNAALSVL